MFAWSIFGFCVLVLVWLWGPVRPEARVAFLVIGAVLLVLALLALCGVVGGTVVIRG